MYTEFTKSMLESTTACERAVRVVSSMLPVRIYLEPEDNLEIATKLIYQYETENGCPFPDCTECGNRDLMSDLRWVLQEILRDEVGVVARNLYKDSMSRHIDPQLVARIIALVAKKFSNAEISLDKDDANST